jgi:two-component system sensor histidine kinase/response regulator
VTPRAGMEEGADDFLVKPVSLKALTSCVAARFKRATISWRVED